MLKKERVTIVELLIRIIAAVAFIFVVSCIIFPFAKGMPVTGLPKTKDISKIEIINTKEQITVIITNSDEIWCTKQLTGMLMYKVNSSETTDDNGYISLSFEDKNGDEFKISATETEVFWNGKSATLKQPEIFVDAIKELYFNR